MVSTSAFACPSPVPRSRAGARQRVRPVAICAAAAPPPPPTDIDGAIALASKSLSDTIASGTKRAKLSALIPGLNPLIEETVPYSDALLNTIAYGLACSCPALAEQPSVALLFKSAGTAAAAQASLRPPQDGPVTFASYFRRDGGESTTRASPHANVLINPTSVRGDRIMDDLETVVDEAPEALWVVLNPDLGLDRAAVGMREMTRRDNFLKTFSTAFYFRNLFEIRRPQLIPVERGALLYTYPGPWRLYALATGSYIAAGEFRDLPGAEAITSSVRKAIATATLPVKKAAREANDSEYLLVLALCAAAFAVAYFAFAVMPRA